MNKKEFKRDPTYGFRKKEKRYYKVSIKLSYKKDISPGKTIKLADRSDLNTVFLRIFGMVYDKLQYFPDREYSLDCFEEYFGREFKGLTKDIDDVKEFFESQHTKGNLLIMLTIKDDEDKVVYEFSVEKETSNQYSNQCDDDDYDEDDDDGFDVDHDDVQDEADVVDEDELLPEPKPKKKRTVKSEPKPEPVREDQDDDYDEDDDEELDSDQVQ